MEAISSGGVFSIRGICPHSGCKRNSAFLIKGNVYQENVQSMLAIVQCQACLKFLLVGVNVQFGTTGVQQYTYREHYPLGMPDDTVPDEIPEEIKPDFKEAIRCHWINGYKACVLMCRRALQVSCDMEKAEGNDLYTQIDDLATKQRITGTLQRMAHRIRLLGKRGAHGDYSDIDATIGVTDALQAITFMRHYFEHVYVLPKQLDVTPKENEATAQAARAPGEKP